MEPKKSVERTFPARSCDSKKRIFKTSDLQSYFLAPPHELIGLFINSMSRLGLFPSLGSNLQNISEELMDSNANNESKEDVGNNNNNNNNNNNHNSISSNKEQQPLQPGSNLR